MMKPRRLFLEFTGTYLIKALKASALLFGIFGRSIIILCMETPLGTCDPDTQLDFTVSFLREF